jgi:hypothetical protein
METIFSSETSISAYKTTRHHKPDDRLPTLRSFIYCDMKTGDFPFSVGISDYRASDELAVIPNSLIISEDSAIPRCDESWYRSEVMRNSAAPPVIANRIVSCLSFSRRLIVDSGLQSTDESTLPWPCAHVIKKFCGT